MITLATWGQLLPGLPGPPGPGVRDRGLTSDLSESQRTGASRAGLGRHPPVHSASPSDLCVTQCSGKQTRNREVAH